MLKMTTRSVLAAVALCGVMVPVFASDTRISISAVVPVRCEMSFAPAASELAGRVTLGTVQQYCNTRYQLRFRHQPLSAQAILGLGPISANASSGSTLIEANGKPIISASRLWLGNGAVGDVQAFSNSVVIEVTPLGF